MLSLNQIRTQTFPVAGRGAYRSADVDAFMQQVYVSFTELISENTSMKKKFASLSTIIDEYNAGKNAIATALVKAQAVADETMLNAKRDATSIVNDAKEEAKTILDESQSKADAYVREKTEAAEANYARSEQELARVMNDVKAQSDAYLQKVNDQAAAIIADANEKAAAIVGAAYKDAKIAKEKTEEIIERANVDIETTRNEILSFKESALQMLSQLVPLIEGIDPSGYAASSLLAETEIPQLDAKQETAPAFELQDNFEPVPEPQLEEAAEPEMIDAPEDVDESEEILAPEESIAAPQETPDEEEAEPVAVSDEDDLIAQISSIINDVQAEPETVVQPEAEAFAQPEPEESAQPSLFDLPPAPQMPAYHPYEPQTEKTVMLEPTEEVDAPVYQVEEIPAAPVQTPAFPEEPLFEEVPVDDDEDEDDDDDEDDLPRDPFKFRLTKNFDIFDDDND